MIAVVTNIDAEHLGTYGHDMARLKNAFVEFLHHLPFYGAAVLCIDDRNVRDDHAARLQARWSPTASRRGRAGARRSTCAPTATGCASRSCGRAAAPLDVALNLPGVHNVLQRAAPRSRSADELGVAGRRRSPRRSPTSRASAGASQRYGEISPSARRRRGSFTLIDDYGHHPAEMAATLAAARGAFPGRRIVVAFQPHRYTRTRDLFDDFVRVLSSADALLLTEVYAAGEAPIVARRRARAGALRCALGGALEPVFVENVADLPADGPRHGARRRRRHHDGRRFDRPGWRGC